MIFEKRHIGATGNNRYSKIAGKTLILILILWLYRQTWYYNISLNKMDLITDVRTLLKNITYLKIQYSKM